MSYWARLSDRLQQPYRLTVLHAETYEQKGEYVIRLGVFYFLIGLVFSVLILSTAALVVFTPLREFIPGYTNTSLIQKQELLIMKVEEMEDKIAQRDSVIKSMLRVTDVDPSVRRKPVTYSKPMNNISSSDEHAHEEESARPIAQIKSEDGTPFQQVKYVTTGGTPPFRFVEPVNGGYLTNRFQPKENHYAIDLAAPSMQMIRSVADGYVIFADYTTETGHVIGVHHSNEFVSFYKHNRTLYKQVGDFVRAGEPIAVIGNSGENSTGPHLHFELWHQGTPIDPLRYLNYK